jgi:hypothetical protein
MIVGDFRTGYTIVGRIAMMMEIVQRLFGPTNRFPTGQHGAYAFCVAVPMWLRLTRSGISHSRELILVRVASPSRKLNVAVGHHMILVSGGAGLPSFLVCVVMVDEG